MRNLLVPLLILLGVGAWLYFGRYYNPEKAFETYQQAVNERNWPTVMASMTPESQDRAIGALIGALAIASVKHQEAADVLAKHGVETADLLNDAFKSAFMNPLQVLEALSERGHEYVGRIANKPDFITDSVNCLNSLGMNTDSFFNKIATTELTNVQVDGNMASGTLSTPIGKNGSTIYFRRVDGRWLIDL